MNYFCVIKNIIVINRNGTTGKFFRAVDDKGYVFGTKTICSSGF